MVQVSYPGVYIQEMPSGVHTITGVSTSIAAFLGRTTTGPIDKAVRCTSMSDFLRTFGDGHPRNRLARSIKQFFDNGGTDCYVIRLAQGAAKAKITLKNAAATPVPVLLALARYEGAWGNGLRLEVDYNTPGPDETFNLRILQESNGEVINTEAFSGLSMDSLSPRYAVAFVNQNSRLITLEKLAASTAITAGYSLSRRPLKFKASADASTDRLRAVLNGLLTDTAGAKNCFEMSVNNGPACHIDLGTTAFPAGSDDETLTAFQQKVNEQLGKTIPGASISCEKVDFEGDYKLIKIVSNYGTTKSGVRIQRSATNDIAGPLMLGIDQGGVEIVTNSDLRPAPTATWYSGDINTLATKVQSAITSLKVDDKEVNFSGNNTVITTAATDKWYKDMTQGSINGNNDGVREKLRIVAKAINDNSGLPFRAEVWGYRLAIVPKSGSFNVAYAVTAMNGTTEVTDISDKISKNARQYPPGNAVVSNYAGSPAAGKDDDGTTLDYNKYIGNINDQTGFHALESVDLFNLMVIPEDDDIDEDKRQVVYGQASIYCQQKRAFLLMDAPAGWTENELPKAGDAEVNGLRALVVKDYSAVFYPRIMYVDAGLDRYMGPSGAIAGLMARIDSSRGVWKAPAGTEADIRGIAGLECNLTDRQNGVYNKLGVNCLRVFPGGIVNWGSRTMDGFDNNSTDWKYIPVRRLALFLEESLYRGSKWVVFEPNDEPLWAKIRQNLGAFMMSLFRQGAFQGSTPDKAFYVKCDRETTTQDDRNNGIVNIEVGFAPLKPAEFVVIKIQQMAGEL